MNKKDGKTNTHENGMFSNVKSYSVDEILAAGGVDAFAEKHGKSWQGLLDALAKIPKENFLTDEEFEEAMKTLNQSK
jgi:hypothetical protein